MVEIKVPELAESITEGTISQWLINIGDQVNKGDSVVELETDKVNIELNAEHSGVVTKVLKEPGDIVEVGDVIAIIEENTAAGATPAVPAAAPEKKAEAETLNPQSTQPEPELPKAASPIASPAARKLARELGIDLTQVSSRDPLGRIRPDDVKAYTPAPVVKEAPKVEKSSPKPAVQQIDEDFEKPVERVKMSRRRQTIAKRLVEVQHTAAMLTTFNEVDMSAVMDLRNKRKDA
ncbi:MAG: biotin/lipoyl-containing protein, partial [Bacillus sp. (in: firmicutes)]